MSATVVVGGQYGSEGKGKIVAYLAMTGGYTAAVRCGGPNSGHTVVVNGQRYALRQVPAAFVNPSALLFVAPGAVIDAEVLLREVTLCDVAPSRLKVDPFTVVVDDGCRDLERDLMLSERIGSTLSGTGGATAKKVLRRTDVTLVKDVPALRQFTADVSAEVNQLLDRGERIIVEGTQGFGLSLHHSGRYPFATSRDTTASGFTSECGLSPRTVGDVVLVVRTYPIRVGGNSGDLPMETSWEQVQKRSGYPNVPREYTTVTGTLRRVAEFDFDLLRRACVVNRPTGIAITGIDYLCYRDFGATEFGALSAASREFVRDVQEAAAVPVTLVSTGPEICQTIVCRAGLA